MKSLLPWTEFSPSELKRSLMLALTHGGDLAEFFFENVEHTRVIWEGGRVDQVITGQDRGAGLRIVDSAKTLYGYTTDLSPAGLDELAQVLSQAVRASRESRESRDSRAPGAPASGKQLGRDIPPWREHVSRLSIADVKESPTTVPLAQKIARLQEADRAAREAFPREYELRQVSCYWIDSRRKTLVANSDGWLAPHEKTLVQLVVEVVGAHGDRVESAHESDGGFRGMEFFGEKSPAEFGREASRRVALLLRADSAPSGNLPVVLSSEAGGTMIHEAVGHGLEADLACNGLSVYQGKLGQTVASPLITVVDDGTMPGRRGSYGVDDEGTAAQKNVLIENGVLKSYLVDRLSALKFDMPSTGNGRRESFRHKPIVRMTNTYIAPGKDDPAQILRDTPYGIFVKAMGGGQVNTVTGDFVFAVTEGYLIRDGKLAEPIRGATLVGNGPKVLASVDRVGSDLGFATGTCGKDGQGAPVTDAQPTLRIPELTIGGERALEEVFPNLSKT